MNAHFERAREVLARWTRAPESRPAVSEIFESHIFCAPLNPDAEQKAGFAEACQALGIKALCLGLDYADPGVVDVLQSTRYFTAPSPQSPVEQMLGHAEALQARFEVIRLKLEAMATDPGVPQTEEAMAAMNAATGYDHYFEYHVKLGGEVSPDNDARLKGLAAELTGELGVKVPFSCNNMGSKNQRFLNCRTYGLGAPASRAVADRVAAACQARGYEVSKIIAEFIVFDTNRDLDRGWLEF